MRLNGTYQAPVSRLITNRDTFFTIANDYEGLTTVQATQAAKPNQVSTNLMIGTNITIPLRCACPAASAAQQQTDHEIINFFLTFVVFPGETLDVISSYPNAYIPDLEAANKVNAHTTPETYTTFLVPLANLPPLSSINFKTPHRLLSNKTHTPSPAPLPLLLLLLHHLFILLLPLILPLLLLLLHHLFILLLLLIPSLLLLLCCTRSSTRERILTCILKQSLSSRF